MVEYRLMCACNSSGLLLVGEISLDDMELFNGYPAAPQKAYCSVCETPAAIYIKQNPTED